MSERMLSVLLVGLAFFIFVLYPLLPPEGLNRALLSSWFTLILIAGSATCIHKRGFLAVSISLAALAFVARIVVLASQTTTTDVAALLTGFAFMAYTIGVVLYRVVRPGNMTTHRISGAVAVYLMIGLAWAFLYGAIEMGYPGAYNTSSPMDAVSMQARLVYFSFVTLTTLGYGDITPIHPLAANLAILEALIGQIFLAVLIARLVSVIARPDPRDV